MNNSQIYLDHASTTAVDPEVLATMLPYFSEIYGNPGSSHTKGYEAKQALDQARRSVAKYFNCTASEIIFTSGGSESNNLAIFGTASANKEKGNHLITTEIEHASVLKAFEKLEKEGFEITYLPVDNEGFVNPQDLEKAITDQTILVSIIYANNEIGVVQPIKELGEICHKQQIPFHTDACQAAGALSLDTEALNLDLMTINGSKIYGPKGIGALFVSNNVKIEPIMFGGSQEHHLRAGTENLPLIIGLAKALEIAEEKRPEETKRLSELRDYLIKNILEKIPKSLLNGPNPIQSQETKRLSNNANISFPGFEGKELLLHLDNAGIYCSTGSTCEIGKEGISKVLHAIGRNETESRSAIRFSLGRSNTKEQIDYVLTQLQKITQRM